jgi:hypothetical protein
LLPTSECCNKHPFWVSRQHCISSFPYQVSSISNRCYYSSQVSQLLDDIAPNSTPPTSAENYYKFIMHSFKFDSKYCHLCSFNALKINQNVLDLETKILKCLHLKSLMLCRCVPHCWMFSMRPAIFLKMRHMNMSNSYSYDLLWNKTLPLLGWDRVILWTERVSFFLTLCTLSVVIIFPPQSHQILILPLLIFKTEKSNCCYQLIMKKCNKNVFMYWKQNI